MAIGLAVRLDSTAEAIPLHYACKAPSFGFAGHIYTIAHFELRHREKLPNFMFFGFLRSNLSQMTDRRYTAVRLALPLCFFSQGISFTLIKFHQVQMVLYRQGLNKESPGCLDKAFDAHTYRVNQVPVSPADNIGNIGLFYGKGKDGCFCATM